MTTPESPRLIVADIVWTGTGDVFEPGVIELDGGRIVAVSAVTGPRPVGPDVVDLGASLVMPGLVNTHHHAFQTLTRAHPLAINKPPLSGKRASIRETQKTPTGQAASC